MGGVQVSNPPIVVVSTGKNAQPWEAQHKGSVQGQSLMADKHIYIDQGDASLPCSQNLYCAIHGLSPETIVVWLDADDWFAHRDVLARVAKAYEDPNVWLTFGQFKMWPTGHPGWASAYKPGVDVRQDTWRATHLKTFRAGLFQCIAKSDLQVDCGAGVQWITRAVDMAIMLLMLEMAQERHLFIPEVLCIYNVANPESAHNKGESDQETAASYWVRAVPGYGRLAEQPW